MDEYLNYIIDSLMDRIIDERNQKIKYRNEYVLLEALRYKISDMTDDQTLTVKEIKEIIEERNGATTIYPNP